jgi:hypothetical protein
LQHIKYLHLYVFYMLQHFYTFFTILLSQDDILRFLFCKQLFKLPYRICVLLDDGFLNKPKHVVINCSLLHTALRVICKCAVRNFCFEFTNPLLWKPTSFYKSGLLTAYNSNKGLLSLNLNKYLCVFITVSSHFVSKKLYKNRFSAS